MTTTSTQHATALGLSPSFGFGDRMGSATPGHIEALRRAGGPIKGIFAQQSIREMTRTARRPADVMTAAVSALDAAGFGDAWGADADHLKAPADVDATLAAGFVFFTIDPSDHVDQQADGYSPAEVEAKYEPTAWVEGYVGRTITVPDGPSISFDELTVRRAAVKYGKAIEHAVALAGYIKDAAAAKSQDYEIEISVDETDQPTTLAEHYIIADQLIHAGGIGGKLVSLAPRFIGELEKGVDYIGDVAALEASLRDHAAIADHLGPYKLSLHSGSDKLSMYPAFGRATKGRFHVKTAGTSYLEAIRAAARHDAALFREIIDFSRGRYDTDKATYHVHADVATLPAPADVASDEQLETIYLECWPDVAPGRGFTAPGRQVLHCTFGSVLTHPEFGPAVSQLIAEHPATFRDILADHFARHLAALNGG